MTGVATVALRAIASTTVLQQTRVVGVDSTIATTIWVLVAALGLLVGHYLGTLYATRSDPTG